MQRPTALPVPSFLPTASGEPGDIPAPGRGPVIGVMGATGGCGTTLLATQGAALLAQRGRRVALLDLDPAGGQALAWLHDRKDRPTVSEALRAQGRLDAELLSRLMTPCAPGLNLLAGPPAAGTDPRPALEPDPGALPLAGLVRLLALAASTHDLVVLDLGRAGHWNAATRRRLAQACTHLALVTRAQLPASGLARELWRELAPVPGGGRLELVVGAVGPHDALTPAEVARAVQAGDGPRTTAGAASAWTALPESPRLLAQALQQGLPLVALDDRDPLVRTLEQWAEARDQAPRPSLAAGRAGSADDTAPDRPPPSATGGHRQGLWQRTTHRLGQALGRAA